MRHRKGFNHLSRKAGHRRAMLANMAASLIKNKRITTTTAKAKALRSYVEPLITKSKNDTTHSRRVVFSYIQDKEAVTELFREVSPKVLERPGGYTRILKLDKRLGDNAEMALIELVDFNENLLTETSAKSTGSRRRRRGGSKKKAEETSAAEAVAETAEAAETEVETKEEVKDQEVPEVKEEKVEEEAKAETPAAEPKEEKKEEKEQEKPVEKQEPKAEASEEKPAEEEKKEEDKEDKKES
jgi:large subunit ribosomal protein L17